MAARMKQTLLPSSKRALYQESGKVVFPHGFTSLLCDLGRIVVLLKPVSLCVK